MVGIGITGIDTLHAEIRRQSDDWQPPRLGRRCLIGGGFLLFDDVDFVVHVRVGTLQAEKAL